MVGVFDRLPPTLFVHPNLGPKLLERAIEAKRISVREVTELAVVQRFVNISPSYLFFA